MVYLGAAVAVIGVVLLANLALTLALVRRVRVLSERPAMLPGRPGLPIGSPVPDFTATTVSGETKSRSEMTGSRSLFGFFDAGCISCHRQLPEFANLAGTISGGAGQVLAVVTGSDERAAEFVSELDGVAAVVREPQEDALCTAFRVKGFPSFYLVNGTGSVEASGTAVRMLAGALQPR